MTHANHSPDPAAPQTVAAHVPAPPQSVVDVVARLVEPPRLEATLAALARYVALTLDAAARMNLTGIREPEAFWIRHIEDSLLAAESVARLVAKGGGAALPESSASGIAARILDVGSGAGLPGMVWALIWPASQITLLEATGKKAAFLTETAAALGARNVAVLARRSEDCAHEAEHRETYDIAAARALAPMNVLTEWTLPFVRVGGALAAIKSGDIEDEWRAARPAATKLGGASPVTSPGADYRRSDGCSCRVIWIEKQKPSPAQYPRTSGAALRRPLR